VYKTTNGGTLWFSSNGQQTLNGTTSRASGSPPQARTRSSPPPAPASSAARRSSRYSPRWTAGRLDERDRPAPDRYPTDIEFDPRGARPPTSPSPATGRRTCTARPTSGPAGPTWAPGFPISPPVRGRGSGLSRYVYVGTDLGVFQSSDAGRHGPRMTRECRTPWSSTSPYRGRTTPSGHPRSGTGCTRDTCRGSRPSPLTSPVGNEVLVAGLVEDILWSQVVHIAGPARVFTRLGRQLDADRRQRGRDRRGVRLDRAGRPDRPGGS